MGASEATLLNMLNISPFSYGLIVEMVYDSGTTFEPKILDIKPEDLRIKFQEVRGKNLLSLYDRHNLGHWSYNFFKIILAFTILPIHILFP